MNGMALTTPANSSLLMATSPIWVAVLGYLLQIERISRVTWYGILLSFVGIIVLITGGGGEISLGSENMVGDLLLLGCAIAWALYTTASKPLLGRYSPLKLTAWTMVAGTIPLVIISMPAIGAAGLVRDLRGRVGGAGLFHAAGGSGRLPHLVHERPAGRQRRTAIYSNLTPVIAIVFAWLTIGSTLAPLQLLGAAVVLSGLVLTRHGRTR